MKKLVLVFGVCILFTVPSIAETIVVDPNGSGDFTNIQDAINSSWHGDTIVVRPGVYSENISFNGRSITVRGTDANDPNITTITIISGAVTFDFGESSDSILIGFTVVSGGIRCNATSPTISKNIIKNCGSYGISGENSSSPEILENVISNNGSHGIYACHGTIELNTIIYNGGGIKECDGTINNNLISENIVNESGAGLASCDGLISNNIITKNQATSGCYGGGMFDCQGTITGNTISDNKALCAGGLYQCHGSIINNMITSNRDGTNQSTTASGGGIMACDANIVNNVIKNNRAGSGAAIRGGNGDVVGNLVSGNVAIASNGGGIVSSEGIVKENIITRNHSSRFILDCRHISNNFIVGNRSYSFAIIRNYYSNNTIKNNIIAFNRCPTDAAIHGPCNNSYNCFWLNEGGNFSGGASKGIGEIIVDPLFITSGYWDPNGTVENLADDFWVDGDYHLKSEAGRWDPNTETWVIDTVTSFCIDFGDPCDTIGYEPNPNGGRINMGAYGGTWEASKSTGGTGPEPPPRCLEYPAMDFNKDCKVDFTDFSIFVQSWLQCNLDPPEACWQ